jgi:alanyl aminopeptidase
MTPGEDRFSGSIAIELETLEPVSTIWLLGKSLTIEKATIRIAGRDWPAQATPAPEVNNNGSNNGGDFIAITTGSTLPAGHATLQISYSGEVSRTLTDGAFQQQQGKDWYIFTKFEPVTARRVFPCFDEPSFKVPWQLTLHIPKDLKAFSAIASLTRLLFCRHSPRPVPAFRTRTGSGSLPFSVLPWLLRLS